MAFLGGEYRFLKDGYGEERGGVVNRGARATSEAAQ
jgi:hypothetical protein